MFDLGAAREIRAVFVEQALQIRDRVLLQTSEMFPDLLHPVENFRQFAPVLLDVEPADPPHRQRQKLVDVRIGDVAPQLIPERRQTGPDGGVLLGFALALLDLLVDPVFKENLRQRLGVKQILLPRQIDFQFPFQIFEQFCRVAPQHLAHGHADRTPFANHGHIHRNRHRAVGIHVERLQRLLRVVPPGRHDLDLHLLGGVIRDR